MKKLFVLAAIFALVFAACEQPTTDNDKPTAKVPSLTIKNESSFDLTDVKFSGISFSAAGSNDLPRTSQSVKQLSENDINKAGYITFTRKDIGIACRTEAVSVGDQDVTFTFLDSSVVEEVANSGNRKSLSQITFLSKVTIERVGLAVAKNDTVNLGETIISYSKQTEFTLKNTGVGKLLFGVNEPVKISGADADSFSVIQPSSNEIASNGSLPFKINFNPKEIRNYTAVVTITSNDQSGEYIFTVTATGAAPKPIASLFYDGVEVFQNGTINAGDVLITQSKNITVVVKNTGMDVLTLSTANITITGAEAAAFIKSTDPSSSISAGSETSFFIECKPTKQGESNAVLTIPTNDNSRNPVTVYLRMTGVKGSAVLELSQGTSVITNNSLTPVDFGRVEAELNSSLTFTIKNNGNIPLELTGNPIVDSSNPVFSVSTQPANKSINPGATVQFAIGYQPTTEGQHTGTITITNNSDDTPFVFYVKGVSFVKKPQITVKQDTAAINQSGNFDLGTILIGTTKDITFTIGNTGEANLSFVNVNYHRINISDDSLNYFSVIQEPSQTATVHPGNSTTFIIRFNPKTVVSNYNAYVQIKTNSEEHEDFSFIIRGNARSYVIGDIGPGGGFVFFAQGGQYKECSGDIGFKNWNDAVTTALNYRGGGFSNWYLPSYDETWDIWEKIHCEGMGDYYDDLYWTSYDNNTVAIAFDFSEDGEDEAKNKTSFAGVIAVRSFSLNQ